MDSVKEFISEDYGYGYGYGSGFGYEHGSGDGYGNGYGDGSGYGNNYDDGRTYGDGSGDGYGDGYGDGSGYGYGYGYNRGIKSFCGDTIYFIDSLPTVLKHVHGNVARGYVLNRTLTPLNVYVVKGGGYFAHGATLREAYEDLENKIFNDIPVEERIEKFLEEFNLEDKYPAKELFGWHGRLTGSCEAGRMAFVRNHGIDLENDSFTVREMIDLCRNDYGSEVIQKLEETINENTR